MSERERLNATISEILGENPGLDDIARLMHALAGAIEDLSLMVENFRTAVEE